MTTIQINPNELSDKRVLVTGGTKGMGEAILQGRGYANVKRMRQAGATVITTARSKPKALPLLPEDASIILGLSGFKS